MGTHWPSKSFSSISGKRLAEFASDCARAKLREKQKIAVSAKLSASLKGLFILFSLCLQFKLRQDKGFNFNTDFSRLQIPSHDGYLRPMKRIFHSAMLFVCVAFLGQQLVFGQATLIDPVEVFQGSLSDPENDEVSLHWDVTNLTDDTLELMVVRNIIQAVDVLLKNSLDKNKLSKIFTSGIEETKSALKRKST